MLREVDALVRFAAHRSRTGATLVASALCVFIPLANAEPVAPGQPFPSDLLNVRAPNAEGWKRIGSSEAGIAFGRNGATSDETYVAQASLFALAETSNRDEFVASIKRGIESDTSPDRFTSIEASYDYTEERGYPCVRVASLSEDTKAKTSSFGRTSLKLQIFSLYCRHPTRQGTGFFAAFSHRGKSLDPELRAPAEEFIEGVQVPSK